MFPSKVLPKIVKLLLLATIAPPALYLLNGCSRLPLYVVNSLLTMVATVPININADPA